MTRNHDDNYINYVKGHTIKSGCIPLDVVCDILQISHKVSTW